MSQFFEYDPHSGATELIAYDATTDRAHITTLEDVEPLVELCKAQANQGLTDQGIKKSWWHYASLPNTIILELKKKGIDIFDKNCGQAMFREINQNYPYLKTTSKRHTRS